LASRSRKALQKASADARLRVKAFSVVIGPAIERPAKSREGVIETLWDLQNLTGEHRETAKWQP